MISAKALLVTGVDTVVLDEVTLPEPGQGEVLIATAFSCVSPGTELRCMAGKEPGSDQWPFVPGYALTGHIAATGPGVTLPVGTPVYADGTRRCSQRRQWGAHLSHAVTDASRVYPLSDSLSLEQASLSALASISYHGVRLSHPYPHETVVVVGLGPIGQFSARLHALTGARVLGVDLSEFRTGTLRQAGIEALTVEGPLTEAVRAVLPDGADVVVDCTGAAAVIPQAIGILRDLPWDDSPTPGPRYLIQGSYGGDFPLPYQPAFMREVSFLLPRNRQPRDVRAVHDLMLRNKLSVDGLLSFYSPEDAPSAYATLKDPRSSLMTVAFVWNNSKASPGSGEV